MVRAGYMLIGLLSLAGCDGTGEASPDRLFPGGKTRAVVLSFDDGAAEDRRVVDILNRYGLVGTFHLNSGKLGDTIGWESYGRIVRSRYVPADVIDALYAGHEVASHTVNHPSLTALSPDSALAEVRADIASLESLAGRPVVSFAWPFGDHDRRLADALRGLGLTNARTVRNTGRFDFPTDPMRWHPTAHIGEAAGLVDDFLDSDSSEIALFYIWGHSWEFGRGEGALSWSVLDSFCRRVGGRSDTWYAGAGDVAAWWAEMQPDASRNSRKRPRPSTPSRPVHGLRLP